MYYVYVLKSQRTGRYYVGYSGDVERRLAEHNRGKVTSTRLATPYDLAYVEEFGNELDARRREASIKRQKSRKYIESLIK